MRTLAKILGYGLVLLLVASAIGLTYKFTNGFNEDFKTFYVEYGDIQILTSENKMTFKKEYVHRFDVKYTFDKKDAEPKDYKVKIVPNMTRDFDYTVDGEKYLFSKTGELTEAFGLVKNKTSFEIYLPDSLSFAEILLKAHGGKAISIPSGVFDNNPYPFRLQVSSYNDKVKYNIDFTFEDIGFQGQPNGGNGNGQGEPSVPAPPIIEEPDEPTPESHNIRYSVTGNESNLLQVEVICNASAVEGETVDFAVSIIGDYKSEVTGITVYSGGKVWTTIDGGENDGASNFYKEYSFTMPDGDVEIAVTIKAIEVSDYHTLSYDTLGYGSVDSITVYMSDVAKADDYVSIYIQMGFDVQDSLTISRVVLQDADTGEEIGGELEGYDGNYDFTMPDCDVVIMIYLIPIDM